MNKKSLLGVVYTCALSALAAPVAATTINYASTPLGQINLDSTDGCGGGAVGCFDFSPGNSLMISAGSTAVGFGGSIEGLFGVGNITPTGSVETALVSGTGTLTIFDASTPLTADLSWLDIGTFGVGGVINISGSINLTNITYAGSNADLLALASAGSGTQTTTFQFATPQSLTNLFSPSIDGVTSTSFSGSINAVPVPAAAWLFGSGLLGLVGVARRKASA